MKNRGGRGPDTVFYRLRFSHRRDVPGRRGLGVGDYQERIDPRQRRLNLLVEESRRPLRVDRYGFLVYAQRRTEWRDMTTSLGDFIREARVRQGKSLRELAKDLDVTPSYLSDIENDRRVPAEPVLRRIAQQLQLDFNELMNLAGRFGDQVERYVKRQPMAVQLFRRIAEANLNEKDLKHLLDEVEKKDKGEE